MFLRIFASIIIAVAGFGGVALASAEHLVISELQTGTSASSGEEFAELYNPTDSDIDVDGWKLEYKSAASADTDTSWSTKATLTGTIKAHGFYLIASADYLPPADAQLSVGFSATAGHVRIVNSNGAAIDKLGYGVTANAPETAPASAPAAGQSLERLPGLIRELAGNGTDTDDNANDFVLRLSPQPQSTSATSEPADIQGDESPENPAPEESEEPTPSPDYLPVSITELLVDPQTPLTDSEDEFIELYNSNSEPVSLEGYVLKSGTGLHDSYTLPEIIINPGEYVVVYAKDTGLSLVNTGGTAQLLDPSGKIVGQADAYPAAEPGLAWALVAGAWQWTLQTTPAQANVLVAPLVADKAKAEKPKATKKASAKAKTKASKAKSAKAVKASKTSKAKVASAAPAQRPKAANFKPADWLIGILITLTLGYAIYEFRYDIQNIYHKLRGHGKARG
ncbi:MAG TPA: lamin tail domain-containing protein [Candidatus Dormibacteraeota bacterium]|nr:lamin tail domain-containing protein [Candidatus Dormibacteraeota bacterium]